MTLLLHPYHPNKSKLLTSCPNDVYIFMTKSEPSDNWYGPMFLD